MTRVLIVDDSAVDRRLMSGILERGMACEIHLATDGRDGFAKCERILPNVILTDLMMPEMDGFELLKAVRAEYPAIPVVLATSHGSEGIAVRALQLGAASYVPKAALAAKLIETVELVLAAAAESGTDLDVLESLDHVHYQFGLGNSLERMPQLVRFLLQQLVPFRVCEVADRHRVGVALVEALKNAYYHGTLEIPEHDLVDRPSLLELAKERCEQPPYATRRVRISADYTRQQAVYVIGDDGPGFDPTPLLGPLEPEQLDRRHGRGLALMQVFMDEIAYNASGNEVTLIKRPSPREADS